MHDRTSQFMIYHQVQIVKTNRVSCNADMFRIIVLLTHYECAGESPRLVLLRIALAESLRAKIHIGKAIEVSIHIHPRAKRQH